MSVDSRNRHAQRALNIYEILVRVFSFNDARTDGRCARVCRYWMEPALDNMWYAIGAYGSEDDEEETGYHYPVFEDLLGFVGPLNYVRTNGQYFANINGVISTEHWDRFRFYADRVKALQIDAEDSIHEDAFLLIGCLRPMLHLLPNLRHFALDLEDTEPYGGPYRCYIKYTILFLHNSLQRLDLYLPPSRANLVASTVNEEWEELLRTFFQEVITRSPNIKDLTLYFPDQVRDVEQKMTAFVGRLRKLETLHIAPCTLTPSLLASLAQIPTLRRIHTIKNNSSVDVSDILVPFALPEHVEFPNLCQIWLAGRLEDLRKMFGLPISPSRFCMLGHLELCALKSVCPVRLQDILSAIADACPRLYLLDISREDDVGIVDMQLERENITASCLEPLTQMSRLQSFAIVLNHPISMDDDELVRLFAKCPLLEDLYLASEPLVWDVAPLLTLNVLGKLASTNCRIRELALYVNASAPLLKDHLPHGRLKNGFTFIDFGLSPIGKSETCTKTVAAYLSKFLPFKSDRKCTRREFEGVTIDRGARREQWDEVYKMLDVARDVAEDYMEQAAQLERRIEELEARAVNGETSRGSASVNMCPVQKTAEQQTDDV